jgi:hypothetical protein
MIDVKTILELGNFDSEQTFFEINYANKWTKAGYKSGFFNKITNIHIGRLTKDRFNKTEKNAYELNNTEQFTTIKKEDIKQDNKQHSILDNILITISMVLSFISSCCICGCSGSDVLFFLASASSERYFFTRSKCSAYNTLSYFSSGAKIFFKAGLLLAPGGATMAKYIIGLIMYPSMASNCIVLPIEVLHATNVAAAMYSGCMLWCCM